MSFPTLILDRSTHQFQQNITSLSNKSVNNLYKLLILTSFFLFLFYTMLSIHHLDQPPQYVTRLSHTNISHLVIAIAGSTEKYKSRKSFIESWWQPNVTKGFLYLEAEPKKVLPWPKSSPPYRIYEDTRRFKPYDKHPSKYAIRMFNVISEIFRDTHNNNNNNNNDYQEIRWYIMADDDTILFLDNLVNMLQKYDHTKYYYIGENSESTWANFDNTYEMAFGGAGYAISYPLAEALYKNVDVCIKRYPTLYGSDHLMQSCIVDLGVSLTHDKGFHQIDLHGELVGFLSSHPQTPLLSLHHLETVEPLFPNMTRSEALNHLMKAANTDQSRVLQQTICYNKNKSWSFSISWGYSVLMYEKIIHPSVLQKPLETFSEWWKTPNYPFIFKTRSLSKDPCEVPHIFFLQNVETNDQFIKTTYTRRTTRKLQTCWRPPPNGTYNSSFPDDDIAKIVVFSPTTKYFQVGARRECCDVLDQVEKNVITIKYSACERNEILGDF